MIVDVIGDGERITPVVVKPTDFYILSNEPPTCSFSFQMAISSAMAMLTNNKPGQNAVHSPPRADPLEVRIRSHGD